MEKKITYREETVFYTVQGTGAPVMLVHGFCEDQEIWKEQVSFLAKKYKLIVPDLPGSGLSPFNVRLSTMTDFADCLKAILTEEKINKCALIGHSMGGYICLAFAEKYAGLLTGFGLFHSSAYADTEEKKKARLKSIEFISEHGSAPFIRQSVPDLFSAAFNKQHAPLIATIIERYANFNPESLVQYLKIMIARHDLTHLLKIMDCPVLFIIGKEDKAVPTEHSLQQSHMPALSYIHILENTAHMGMIENTSLCNNFLDRFLQPFSESS